MIEKHDVYGDDDGYFFSELVTRDFGINCNVILKSGEVVLSVVQPANEFVKTTLPVVGHIEVKSSQRQSLKSDIEKVRAFGVMMNAIEHPSLETLQGKQLLFDVNVYIKAIVKLCKEFQS